MIPGTTSGADGLCGDLLWYLIDIIVGFVDRELNLFLVR
jgi:hypothetical protein